LESLLFFEEAQINSPGYAMHRLHRALETATEHSDPDVRGRALRKIERWQQVITGMETGNLTVGSRTPVAETPPWVTLEVAHGGFATGNYLAEGDLQSHEITLLEELGDGLPGSTERARLNTYYLSDGGQQILSRALKDGAYTVSVPEEGALLTVVRLLEGGYVVQALSLIEELAPFFHRLRFYPKLKSKPQPPGHLVRRSTVGGVKEKLLRITPQPQVSAMREALSVWNPLFDELLTLWLDTVDGDPPRLTESGVVGGWPNRLKPEDWDDRREEWLKKYGEAAREHRLCSKHRKPKSNFNRLKAALVRSSPLSSRELGWVRRALANEITKRGLPRSPQRNEVRAEQSAQLNLPTRVDLARSLVDKLEAYPDDGGLPEVSPLVAHIELKLKQPLEEKLKMALESTLDELVQLDVVSSAEVLAHVLPQLTSQVAAAGIEDKPLRRLFTQIYTAFRMRRSLLLLNYESQVRLEELPWLQALEPFRVKNLAARTVARQTLENVSLLALSYFPHTIIPNRLASEISTLVEDAKLELPIVEELAADIFMGGFTAKWKRANELAYGYLADSFYGRYYQLELSGDKFGDLCSRRAKEAGEGGSWVARNGAVIEQSMILTTHNLATLTFGLGLEESYRQLAPELSRRAFSFVVERQNRPVADFRARLQMIKNTAYAWRQAIFFLSLAGEQQQSEVLTDLQGKIQSQDPEWINRFQPALNGLWHVFEGGRFDSKGIGATDRSARRFLGWSCGHHWLMPGSKASETRRV